MITKHKRMLSWPFVIFVAILRDLRGKPSWPSWLTS
jgi:hypothetical protein